MDRSQLLKSINFDQLLAEYKTDICTELALQESAFERPKNKFPQINAFSKPLPQFFEHTFLKPHMTKKDLQQLCDEARQHQVVAVCIPPSYVNQAQKLLNSTDVNICSVIGFPLGYTTTANKAHETRQLLEDGCDEFDMVLPIGRLIDKQYTAVFDDITAVVAATDGRIVKVILETALLTTEQIVQAGILCRLAGAHYLKTSTGFANAGATAEHVSILRAIATDVMGVKAAGGIREYGFAKQLIAAGADRIGCSNTVHILNESSQQ